MVCPVTSYLLEVELGESWVSFKNENGPDIAVGLRTLKAPFRGRS